MRKRFHVMLVTYFRPNNRLNLCCFFTVACIQLTSCLWYCGNICENELAAGPECFKPSRGAACLKEHLCEELALQYEKFEKLICQSPYLTEFENKPQCWRDMFKKCHGVAIMSESKERSISCVGKYSEAFFYNLNPHQDVFCAAPVHYFLYDLLFHQNCHKFPSEPYKPSGCSHYCQTEIFKGPECAKMESEGVQCLSNCTDLILQDQANQLNLFEDAVCQNDLSVAVDNSFHCWWQLFKHCKDVAVIRDNVTLEFCQKQHFLLAGCRRRLAEFSSSCITVTNHVLKLLLRDLRDDRCVAMLSRASRVKIFSLSIILQELTIVLLLLLLLFR